MLLYHYTHSQDIIFSATKEASGQLPHIHITSDSLVQFDYIPLLNFLYNKHSTSNSTAYYHSSNAHQFLSISCRAVPSGGAGVAAPPLPQALL